jgi:hypothetical protein
MTDNTIAIAKISEERLSHIKTAYILRDFAHRVTDDGIEVVSCAETLDYVTKTT